VSCLCIPCPALALRQTVAHGTLIEVSCIAQEAVAGVWEVNTNGRTADQCCIRQRSL
jgi:hypothetical protein